MEQKVNVWFRWSAALDCVNEDDGDDDDDVVVGGGCASASVSSRRPVGALSTRACHLLHTKSRTDSQKAPVCPCRTYDDTVSELWSSKLQEYRWMFLTWCHFRSQLIDNAFETAFFCDPSWKNRVEIWDSQSIDSPKSSVSGKKKVPLTPSFSLWGCWEINLALQLSFHLLPHGLGLLP